MSTVSLTVKPISGDGTTSYVDGNYLPAAELQADFDALVNVINGNLDEDNLHSSTQIPNSMLVEIQPDIVDAHADSATEYLTATTPGTTAALIAGTTAVPALLTDELERLRYRLLANNHLISTYFMDSGGLVKDAGWVESAPFGPQLFVNNGFEVKTSATASVAPDNWTLVGTPTSLVITAPGLANPTAGKYKKAIRITCSGAANEGVQQTLYGMKASTKYLIGMTFAKVSGTPILKIETTNGLASGAYQNLAVTTATIATIQHVQAIVQTTTTGTDLTVKFTNTVAAADVFDIYQVWAYEVKDSTNLGLPHIPMKTASLTTEDTTVPAAFVANPGSSGNFTFETYTSFSLSQYIPLQGYKITYEVDLSLVANSGQQAVFSFEIQEDSGSGASTVEGPYMYVSDDSGNTHQSGQTIKLRFIRESPTAGLTYAYTTRIGAFGNGANYVDMTLSPKIGDTAGSEGTDYKQMSSRARLIVERL